MTKKKTIYRGGCLSCPGNEDILDMNEVLYQGFGGYHVKRNGKIFYIGDSNLEWEKYKTLKDIEKSAKKDPKAKWQVILDNPLRGAIWERNKNGEWLLKETNLGFA